MRTIERSTAFKRDYKREAKGKHRATLDGDLRPVLLALATDQALDTRYRAGTLSLAWLAQRAVRLRLTRRFAPGVCCRMMSQWSARYWVSSKPCFRYAQTAWQGLRPCTPAAVAALPAARRTHSLEAHS